MPIRVLLVDDSAVIRGLMNKAISQDPAIEVIGTAANGEMAIAMAARDKPDVVILDIEMPVMDGITALPHILKASPGTKIIMASTLTQRNAEISMNALAMGASDYLAKPSAKFGKDVEEFYRDLMAKIRALANAAARVARPQAVVASAPPKPAPVAPVLAPSNEPLTAIGIRALAIASSTGGPQALMSLFEQIKGRLTNIPIFITQHMPPTFTAILADHLGKAGERPTAEGKEGMIAAPGHAYIAPGDYHMVMADESGKVVVHVNQGPQESFCRPAADPMLRSLSAIYGKHLLVLVLTGMGQDGLEGAKIVVRNGGHVIAQNEESCVVYGMPKAVVENKLCRAVLPLSEIGRFLAQNIEGR
ncbi:MAG: chemotaxis response regulator protein-glutamate methylesterase [Alphaproteobacteria bacterium]|nr:chemotaxis response regulator protein-glutamate methylesterase [Alphaproteobacteria bacterium]